MASPTLIELRGLLRIYVDDRSGDRFDDTLLNTVLNEAQRHIQQMIEAADENYFVKCQSYTVVAAPDSFEFDLPDDFRRALILERLVTGGRPVPAEWVDFRQRHPPYQDFPPYSATTSLVTRPKAYLRTKKLGIVAPSEGYTVTLWYSYNLPTMVLDNDESDIPAEHRGLIQLYAVKLLQGSDEGGMPQDLRDAYDEKMAALIQSIFLRQTQTPRTVLESGDW